MMKSVFLIIPIYCLILVTSVEARDVNLSFSIKEAMNSEKVSNSIDSRIKLYWGNQGYAGVVKNNFDNYKALQRSTIHDKTKQGACDWALAGAIKKLQNKAMVHGANAVINITSEVANSHSSTSEYQCVAGSMLVKVILSGDIVEIGQGSGSQAISEPKRDIIAIQTRLKVLGYTPGTPDGVVGPSTRAAIKQYQSDNNLAVTGGLDKVTVARIHGEDTLNPEDTIISDTKIAAAIPEAPKKDAITIKLEQFDKLRKEGAITEDEFLLLKEKALNEYLGKE